LSYSTTTRTASNVVATITFNETTVITNNGGSNKYTFTENGQFAFQFVDEAGNVGEMLAVVENIDRSTPSAAISLSTLEYTRGPIEVVVSVEALENAKIGTAVFENSELAPTETKTRNVSGQEVIYEAAY